MTRVENIGLRVLFAEKTVGDAVADWHGLSKQDRHRHTERMANPGAPGLTMPPEESGLKEY